MGEMRRGKPDQELLKLKNREAATPAHTKENEG